MKRILILLQLLVFASFYSCHHHERPEVHPTLKISSKQLEVSGRKFLLFSLPEEFQKNEPVISEFPKGNAELLKDDSGKWMLRYQSKDGMPGTDRLNIDSEFGDGEDHPHCGGGLSPRPFFGHHPERDPKDMHERFRIEIEISILQDAGNPIENTDSKGSFLN